MQQAGAASRPRRQAASGGGKPPPQACRPHGWRVLPRRKRRHRTRHQPAEPASRHSGLSVVSACLRGLLAAPACPCGVFVPRGT